MIYTQKIQKAIKFAAKTHNHYQQQLRKGKVIPYISHPLTVGIILAVAKAPEDVIVAGILHDTIEDSVQEKKVSPAMLAERFGEKVKDLVLSVTETDRDLPWAERKAQALDHIANFLPESVLVKSADVLSNGTELWDDYQKDGEEVFTRFRATAADTLANYEKVASTLLARWPESPLADDLRNLLQKLDAMKKPSQC